MVTNAIKKTVPSVDLSVSDGEWVISLDPGTVPEVWLYFKLLSTGGLTELTLGKKSDLLITISKSAQKDCIILFRGSPTHAKILLSSDQIEYLLSFLLEAEFKRLRSTHFHFTGREGGREKDLTITYSRNAAAATIGACMEISIDLFCQDSRFLVELSQNQIPHIIFATSTSLSELKNSILLVDKNSSETLILSPTASTKSEAISISPDTLRKFKTTLTSMLMSGNFWSSPLVIIGEKNSTEVEIEFIVKISNPTHFSN